MSAYHCVTSPPCVLVFSGSDCSGGAGLQADITSLNAMGCHALSIPTVLTVQDNVHVHSVYSVPADLINSQACVLSTRFQINSIKIGVVGTFENAQVIVNLINKLRLTTPTLPVVLDPILANSNGNHLSNENTIHILELLYKCATVITPNLNEAIALCDNESDFNRQAKIFIKRGCQHVLLKGGHGSQYSDVINRWYTMSHCFSTQIEEKASWTWPRLPDEFHGSGCTLAAALSATLAKGLKMYDALTQAQLYTQHTLNTSYAIAPGQRIPNRILQFNL